MGDEIAAPVGQDLSFSAARQSTAVPAYDADMGRC